MGKIVSDFHTQRIERIIKGGGGEILMGGNIKHEAKYVEPTIILNPDKNSELMKEEIFGPVLPIVPFESLNEVIDSINNGEKPLAVYYFGNQNSDRAMRVMRETSSGSFVTNEMILQMASHYTGFGGVGGSGYGRYAGFEGYKNFTNRKGVLFKKHAPPFMASMATPPYTDGKKNRIRWALACCMAHN